MLVTLPPCEKPAFIFDDATSTEGCMRGGGNVVESVRSLVSLSGAALHDLFSTRRRREGEGAYKREKEREEREGWDRGRGGN